MKQRLSPKATFIAKSLLWSLMIYIGCMTAINWDEINYAVKVKQPVSAITQVITQPANLPVAVTLEEPLEKPNTNAAISLLGLTKAILIQVVHIITK